MSLIYDGFTVICNEKVTHYISENNKSGITNKLEESGIYLYSDNKMKSFICKLDQVDLILKKVKLNFEVEEILNEFLKYRIQNYADSSYIEMINKDINDILVNTFKSKYIFLTSIECINIDKLICNKKIRKCISDKYFIFSYSILNKSKTLISDFLVCENMNEESINKAVQRIFYEVKWIEKNKAEVCTEKLKKIILKNTATGIFFHECIGHFLEADFYNGSPIRLIKDRAIMPTNITIYENHNIINNIDDFGNEILKNTILIEDGYVKNILSNKVYSYLLKIDNSANEVNERINIFSVPRMRSMLLKPSKNNIQNLIFNLDNGVLVEEISMGEVDVYSGEFSILVSKSYLIKNGKCISALGEFSLNYNIKDLENLKITICDDLKKKSNLCGKGTNIVKLEYCTPSVLIEF